MVPLLSMGYAALVDNNLFLGYKWVTKSRRLAVNQTLFGTHRRLRTHISSKLVTVVSSAISASVNSYTPGLLKIRSKTNRGVPKLFSSVIVSPIIL